MAFKTTKSDLLSKEFFFTGTNDFAVTTAPSNEVKITGGAATDLFGYSVAVGSGRIVVGAYQDDDSGADNGAIYIYDLEGNLISKVANPAAAGFGEDFGRSVAVGSGRIVVGTPYGSPAGEGCAYLFDLEGNLIKKITAPTGLGGFLDVTGTSVAIGSGRIVVGAPGEFQNGSKPGSAYIYDLDGNFITKLTAFDGAVDDLFGFSVAVGSGRVVVGARGDDDNGSQSGSAYIYDLDGNLITKITAPDGDFDDFFGYSVAVGSGRIVVGAWGDNPSGGAYVYDLDGNYEYKLSFPFFYTEQGDRIGFSVAVGSGRIIVGASLDNDKGTNSGAAYVFNFNNVILDKVTASDGASGDLFGTSVAVGSGRIVVGAFDGSAYIYETPDQTHYLDILDD